MDRVFSAFEQINSILSSFSIYNLKNRYIDNEVLIKGHKKWDAAASRVNLKSNTMKNTLQIYNIILEHQTNREIFSIFSSIIEYFRGLMTIFAA